MSNQIIFVFLAIVVLCYADKDISEGDIKVNVKDQSGKITLAGNGNVVTVNYDYIHELDSAGVPVGSHGQKYHSIESFAKQVFEFKNSGLVSQYQNIAVKHVQFEGNISGPGAKLTVDLYIFKGAGSIATSRDEILEVKKGTVKFGVKIEKWSFCGAGDSCSKGSSSEKGRQIELGIEIKGRKKPAKKAKANGKGRKVETLDLGGADCTLSGAVEVDGIWQEMAESYPKVETIGTKTLFIFRFPKFSRSVKYDPTMELSSDQYNSSSRLQVGFLSMLLSIAALLKLLLQRF